WECYLIHRRYTKLISMASSNNPGPPLRVLSLDGGGIRGKSSLLILENIMERIRESKGLDLVPRPCEYFDLIGGTSTGGPTSIIAIMLGRLGMTVHECIEAYDHVGRAAFTPKRTLFPIAQPRGAFSATALEFAIKQVIRKHCTEPICATERRQGRETTRTCIHEDLKLRDATCTKTVVLAITKADIDSEATLLTTYDSSTSFKDCTIWEVARATSAATTFFKSIELGRDKIEFIDAGFGYNNPCEILINEAEKQFPDRRRLHVLSIGTGLGDVVSIRDSRVSILKALKSMASSSTAVAHRLGTRYIDRGTYYRFNVERGLDDITLSDWQLTSTIAAHTHNYLRENERAIRKFVDGLDAYVQNTSDDTQRALARVERIASIQAAEMTNNDKQELETYHRILKPGTRLSDLSTATQRRAIPYTIPFPSNPRFFGREKLLQQLHIILKLRDPTSGFASVQLHGLGGVGKTQTALEFVYRHHYSVDAVFWVLAENSSSLANCFSEFATSVLKLSGAQRDNPLKNRGLVLDWLQKTDLSWLIVFDNVDSSETLMPYWPVSDKGAVIVTTRKHNVARHLVGTAIAVETFSPEDGAEFLMSILDDESSSESQRTFMLSRSMKIEKFLRLYLQRPDRFHTQHKDGYSAFGYTMGIDTVWDISFNALSGDSKTLLGICAFLSPDKILRSLFVAQDDQLPSNLLFCQDDLSLDDAIEPLLELGLAEKDTRDESLRLHRLVQSEYLFRSSTTDRQTSFECVSWLLKKEFSTIQARRLRYWPLFPKYLQHLLRLVENYQTWMSTPDALRPTFEFCDILMEFCW
ncbi:acyl transferase/acyl hydrolase/lysophospholipase, partial [Apiospora kogelbergensis]|uniref:acyl transferase/acyl hydrolase/lysophospholipase n=1 Tax=Apiospora kogelbergensis TaxID=1337665 RepID=UPI003131A2EE